MNKERYHYNNYNIIHEFCKLSYNREVVFLPSKRMGIGAKIRMARCHNFQSFKFWFDYVHLCENPRKMFNVYYSLATYKNGIPRRDMREMSLDFSYWTEIAQSEMSGYDMLIDIDADKDEIGFAHYSAVLVCATLSAFNVPHYIRFSGSGFHIIIPYEVFKPLGLSFFSSKKNNIYEYMRQIAVILHDDFSEMVDTTIYDSRRIVKFPYSLAIYPNEIYVCMPVSDLVLWDIESCKLENFKYSDAPEVLQCADGNIKLLDEWVNGKKDN